MAQMRYRGEESGWVYDATTDSAMVSGEDDSASPSIVLHVITSLGVSGGAEQQLVSNLRHFRDASFEHHIVFLQASGFESRADEADAVAASVQPLFSVEAKRSRLQAIKRLDAVVRELEPSLIHCSLADAALAARIVARYRRVRVLESLVNIAYDPVRLVDNTHVQQWKLNVHQLVDRVTMARVDEFHALSEVVARSWSRSVGISPDRIHVIPRGVNIEGLVSQAAAGPSREDLAKEFRFDPSSRILLSVGRLEPQKGQRYLIQALPEIFATEPDTVLLIAGRPGNSSGVLADEARRLGVDSKVRFTGRRTDIPALIKASDVFVFPSLFEGLGVSLLEALALSAAVATSDVEPMNGVVVDGENGRLFEPRSASDIASVVIELLDDEQQRFRLGKAGRATIAESFTAEVAASRLEQLYRIVLGLA